MSALTESLPFLDYAAGAVFGATGALAAARKKHDLVTFAFFAAVTGVGGGTLRDVLLGAPVFWVQRPAYLGSCLLAALAVWVIEAGQEHLRVIAWLDAIGLAAYAVVGAAKAASMGAPPLSMIVMGVLTASFGGVIRDVLAHEPSILLRWELYITAALLGASTYTTLAWVDISPVTAGAHRRRVRASRRSDHLGLVLARISQKNFSDMLIKESSLGARAPTQNV